MSLALGSITLFEGITGVWYIIFPFDRDLSLVNFQFLIPLISGIFLIISYYGFAYLKDYFRGSVVVGCLLSLLWRGYLFWNYLDFYLKSEMARRFVIIGPPILLFASLILLILTLVYWREL